MVRTNPKRAIHRPKRKKSDEVFCFSCSAIIKKDADICLNCGVRNKLAEYDGKPKGSSGWLIFWIIVFWPVAIWYFLTRRWD